MRCCATTPACGPRSWSRRTSRATTARACAAAARFLELARDPEIVELVSDVIGDDVILWGCHVFCKPAGEGYETPWHQDGHYWPIRPLATCTVWVALDPSTAANGCLRVIPGSQRDRVLHAHLHESRTDLTLEPAHGRRHLRRGAAVDIELEPGQMSLHDVYMIHGAAANTLDAAPHRRRAALHAVDLGVRARPAAGRRQDRPVASTSRAGRCGWSRASTAAAATTSRSGTGARLPICEPVRSRGAGPTSTSCPSARRSG